MNFLPLSAMLIAGIYSSQHLRFATLLIVSLLFIALSFITFKVNRKLRADIICMVVAFVCGVFLYNLNSAPKSQSTYESCYVTLHGCVCSMPYEYNGINRFIVYADKIEMDDEIAEFKNKVLVNSEESFRCGDSIVIHGKLERINTASSDDIFVSKNYYASKGIFYKTTALSVLPSTRPVKYFSLSYYGDIARSKCADIIRSHYEGDIAAALIAIITGDKHGFSDDYNAVLEYTGTRHLFYPAFIHIMLMSYFIGIFASVMPRRTRDFSLVVMLAIYAAFAASPSALKSAAVLVIIILCKNIFGSCTYINSLSLFVLIIGLVEPMLFFNAGFAYSIASTIIIRTFSQLLYGQIRLTRFLGKYLIFTVGLAPLSLYMFGKISIYSFAASFIFMPVLSLILILLPLFILSMKFSIFFPAAWLVEKYIMVLLHIPVLIEALPFSHLTFSKPSVVSIAAFYCAAAAIWYFYRQGKLKQHIFTAIALGLLCSELIYAACDFGKLHISFIDVGQGDATLIQRPYKCNIIIDGGGSAEYSQFKTGEKIFLPYLTKHGASIIQAAFVSHYHNDHTEGIASAIENLDVKNLFMPDVYPESEIRLQLERLAKENGTKLWYISHPTTVSIDDVIIEVIPPSEAVLFSNDENDSSMYITVNYGNFNAAFTGDMSEYSENNLLARNAISDVDVLKVAHHGSDTSTSYAFLSSATPEYALIGVGKNNEYSHPHKAVLSRLGGTEVFRTDLHGNIILTSDKNGNIEVKYDK